MPYTTEAHTHWLKRPMVARDKLNASKVEEEVERKKKVSTRFDIHTKYVGMRACVLELPQLPVDRTHISKKFFGSIETKCDLNRFQTFFHISFALCVCESFNRTEENEKNGRRKKQRDFLFIVIGHNRFKTM